MMYHSVITPHSYHGYQGNTEDRVIPVKIGCAERSNRTNRALFTIRKQELQSRVENAPSTSTSDLMRSIVKEKSFSDSLYRESYQAPRTSDKTRPKTAGRSARIPLRHLSRGESEQERQSCTATFNTTYSSNYNKTYQEERRPASVGALTDFNRRKWKIAEDFKPGTLRRTKQEDIKKASQSNKFIKVASAVGSVRDQRSEGRVNLREGFVNTSTYTQDIGARSDQPINRIPKNCGKIGEDMSMYSTTRDLGEGTSKCTKYNLSYMGHVPMNERNRQAMFDTKHDIARHHTKDSLLYTVEHNIPGYSGHKPHSTHNGSLGPVHPSDKTTSHTTFKNHERILKDHDKPFAKRKWMLTNFFAAPAGETAGMNSTDGNVDAELFYHRYRPKEAMPKLGMKSDHAWISNHELKRSYVFTSAH